jgi:hypothetical protein
MNYEKSLTQTFERNGKGSEDWPYLAFNLKLGNKKIIQARKVYSLLDYGSDLGGLYGCIQPVCAILCTLFSGVLYQSNLVMSIFPVYNEGC